jgi:hypothetical protein
MPRTPRKPSTPAKPQPNAFVASAARVVAGRRKNIPNGTGKAWQDEVWELLDKVGELEFYRTWITNALSRCTLDLIEVAPDGSTVPATDPQALAALATLFDGEAGQSEMLGTMGGHIALPGETWLCGLVTPSEDPTIDTWRVLSRDEVKAQGNKWTIDRGDGEPESYEDDEILLYRIWRPHPRKYVEANSSVRSAIPILRELLGLSMKVSADIDSRLSGAGILVVPNEMTFSSPAASGQENENDPALDPFITALIEVASAAISDRADASANVPLVLRGPAQYLDAIKHITFSTPLDDKAQGLRQECITRLANSLDVPAEILTGMADVNHWTGWLLDENAIKMHVEPVLAVITAGLTTRYLWPSLQGQSDSFDPALRRFQIVGNTSRLRQRPNLSADAEKLYDSLDLTRKALGRETGFEDGDFLKVTDPEFRSRLLVKIATGANPDLAVAALAELGITLEVAPAGDTGNGQSPAEAVDPTLDTTRAIPVQPTQAPDQIAAVTASAELLITRALERGWNRAGRKGRSRGPIPAESVDMALTDAWRDLPRAAHLTGVDPERLGVALDTYTRRLLLTGDPLDPMTLRRRIDADVIPRALEPSSS